MSSKYAALSFKWDVGSSVASIAVSHDGNYIVTGSQDGNVRIWDLNNGRPIHNPIKGHNDWVWSVALSPDGARMASGSNDGTVCIWDTSTGSRMGEPLTNHTSAVWSVAFSPNNLTIVSGSSDRTIRIWDAKTRVLIGNPMKRQIKPIRSVAFSPSGAYIVSGSEDGTVCIWDALTRTAIGEVTQGHSNIIHSVAFSPDNNRIASVSSDGTLRIWNVGNGDLMKGPLQKHAHSFNSVNFSPDSTHIITGSDDRAISIWDAETGQPVGEPLKAHANSVHSVVFSSDSTQIISGSLDCTVSVWEVAQEPVSAVQNTSSYDIVSSKMTTRQMLNLLVKHGCANLSASIDLTQRTSVAIGAGGFGDVWRTVLVCGKKVAIKTLRQQFITHSNKQNTKRAAQEMYMWSKLQNPNVQELLGVVVFQGELGVVSPWMELGDLDQYLKDHSNLDKYWLCVQLTSGVSYLHTVGMVHGDIKAKNVLVSEDGTLKINDFDHAILADCTLRFTTSDNAGGGTLRWMAPELLLSDSEEGDEEGEATLAARSKESDVYALGMALLEIITGTMPYCEYRNDQAVIRALDNKKPPRRPKVLSGAGTRSSSMWELLLKCWSYNPSARPQASSLFISTLSLANHTPKVLGSTPSIDDFSSRMSEKELFDWLVVHGCPDLSMFVDTAPRASTLLDVRIFGYLHRLELSNGTVVAVKTSRQAHLLADNNEVLKIEAYGAYIWSRLRHQNVQELFGVTSYQGTLRIVMPWMEHGNLQEYIASHPEVERYQLCAQLATGVSYLHSVGVVHGNLKASKLLMSQDGALKISYFGYATHSSGPLRLSTPTTLDGGSLRWMAPELLGLHGDDDDSDDQAEDNSRKTRTTQTDIYALGMTMLEILTGLVPYAQLRDVMAVYRSIYTKRPPKRTSALSRPDSRANPMWELLLKCWDHDRSARPDAAMVLTSLEGLVI